MKFLVVTPLSIYQSILILSSRSVSGVFPLVDFSPCNLMCRCPVFVFLYFSIRLLIGFSVRPDHVFSKPCLVALRRLAVVGLNSSACKYFTGSGFYVFDIILFVATSDCWVSMGTSQIPFFLLLVPLIISFTFFWTNVSYLSSVMEHP